MNYNQEKFPNDFTQLIEKCDRVIENINNTF